MYVLPKGNVFTELQYSTTTRITDIGTAKIHNTPISPKDLCSFQSHTHLPPAPPSLTPGDH